jgi:hypothetical protein
MAATPADAYRAARADAAARARASCVSCISTIVTNYGDAAQAADARLGGFGGACRFLPRGNTEPRVDDIRRACVRCSEDHKACQRLDGEALEEFMHLFGEVKVRSLPPPALSSLRSSNPKTQDAELRYDDITRLLIVLEMYRREHPVARSGRRALPADRVQHSLPVSPEASSSSQSCRNGRRPGLSPLEQGPTYVRPSAPPVKSHAGGLHLESVVPGTQPRATGDPPVGNPNYTTMQQPSKRARHSPVSSAAPTPEALFPPAAGTDGSNPPLTLGTPSRRHHRPPLSPTSVALGLSDPALPIGESFDELHYGYTQPAWAHLGQPLDYPLTFAE